MRPVNHALMAATIKPRMTITARTAANDNFANVTAIANISGNLTGTNAQATKETGEPNHAGNPGGKSVWYKWTAPALNYSATFTLKNSSFDTLLAVYTGSSVNALTLVASSDDYGHFFQGRVIFPATANAVYYIAVGGFNGGSGAESGTIQLTWHINIEPISGCDYDGDLFDDLAVFRPSNGTWYARLFGGGLQAKQFGAAGDVPVPADYDGDDKTDVAVFRPSTGYWYVLTSRTNSLLSAQWGQNGDIPQPAVSFGAAANFIVYRPGNSTFYIRDPNNAGNTSFVTWGTPGDIPTTAPFVVEP
jgi:hypothetical protein